MSKSILGQVLDVFEENKGPLTISQIARNLSISPAQVEGMIHYWVRKGKLRQSASYSACGTCGNSQDCCPFVIELPRGFELVSDYDGQGTPFEIIGVSCHHIA